MVLQPFVGPWPFFSFLILYTIGRTPWRGDQPIARPLPIHRTTQTQNKRTQTSIFWVGFKPTAPAFERAKRVHALDRAATMIGVKRYNRYKMSDDAVTVWEKTFRKHCLSRFDVQVHLTPNFAFMFTGIDSLQALGFNAHLTSFLIWNESETLINPLPGYDWWRLRILVRVTVNCKVCSSVIAL
jgi:hypothetical protein